MKIIFIFLNKKKVNCRTHIETIVSVTKTVFVTEKIVSISESSKKYWFTEVRWPLLRK